MDSLPKGIPLQIEDDILRSLGKEIRSSGVVAYYIFIPYVQQQKEEKVEPESTPLSGDERDDEDLDGVPLDGAALIKSALLRGIPEAQAVIKDTPTRVQETSQDADYDDDIDGIPSKKNCVCVTSKWRMIYFPLVDDDIDGIPLDKLGDTKASRAGAFIPSKWETVDPEQVRRSFVVFSHFVTLEHL